MSAEACRVPGTGQKSERFNTPGAPISLAVSRLHVVRDVEDWSAPCVMAALAGVVHDRQAASTLGFSPDARALLPRDCSASLFLGR